MEEKKKMRRERIINTVTVGCVIVTTICLIALIAITGNTFSRVNSLQAEVEELKAADNTVTRVIRISDGDGFTEETLSLTPQGWLDFIRTYDVPNATISNLDFEEMFDFIPLQFEWEEEVKEFLKRDKTTFAVWTPEEGYDESLYCTDFVLSYKEYRDGIKLLFQNQEDDIEVESELSGALHPKKVYNFIGGANYNFDSLYYMVYEDKTGNVIAINDDFKAFLVTVKQ